MTRIIKQNGLFNVQDKFLWFWDDKTAKDKFGNDLPCALTGFSSLTEALAECQTTPVYIHENCLDISMLEAIENGSLNLEEKTT